MLAIFSIGAVAMVLDPSAGAKHVERCCTMVPPRALVAARKAHLLRIRIGGLRKIPLKYSIGGWAPFARRWERLAEFRADAHLHQCDFGTPALLTFTSGSTGQPKAAVRSHGLLLAQRTALKEALELTPGEGDLTTLPIFVLANLACGVSSVIADADLRKVGAVKAGPIVRQIQEQRPVSTVASPAFLERVVEHCESPGIQLESFRRIYTGGAPVFPKLMKRLKKVAPAAEVVAVYGSTEAEPIAHVAFGEMSEADLAAMREGKGLLAGRPVRQIELRILKNQWSRPIGDYSESAFAADCMKSGEVGEIVVHGDHVLQGYLRGMGDQETKFRVGGRVWHRTGDLGYLDGEGRLWLLGRCEGRIEDAKGELFPFAVECAAMESEGVKRAALVAVSGRRILAVEGEGGVEVELKKKLSWAELDEVRRVAKVPVDKRHNAKVDYVELRRMMGS